MVIIYAARTSRPVWPCTPEFAPGLTGMGNCRCWRGAQPRAVFRWKPCRQLGSGWKDRRKAVCRIFQNGKVQVIVVEHRARRMRFGFEYVEAAPAAEGGRVVVVDGALCVTCRKGWLPPCARRWEPPAWLITGRWPSGSGSAKPAKNPAKPLSGRQLAKFHQAATVPVDAVSSQTKTLLRTGSTRRRP